MSRRDTFGEPNNSRDLHGWDDQPSRFYSDDEDDTGFGYRFSPLNRNDPWQRSERSERFGGPRRADDFGDFRKEKKDEKEKPKEESGRWRKEEADKKEREPGFRRPPFKPESMGIFGRMHRPMVPPFEAPRPAVFEPTPVQRRSFGRRSPSLELPPFSRKPVSEAPKPKKEEGPKQSMARHHFKYEKDGEIRRFALPADTRLDTLLADIFKRVDKQGRTLYWHDDEGRVQLATIDDLEVALEYAKLSGEKSNKLPCLRLEVVDKTKEKKKEEKKKEEKEEKKKEKGLKMVHEPEKRQENRMQSEIDYSRAGAICDHCDCYVTSKNGGRYKCTVCDDYDLCAKCAYEGHHKEHALLRVFSDATRVHRSGLTFGAATPFMIVPQRFRHGGDIFGHLRMPKFEEYASMAEKCIGKHPSKVFEDLSAKAAEAMAAFETMAQAQQASKTPRSPTTTTTQPQNQSPDAAPAPVPAPVPTAPKMETNEFEQHETDEFSMPPLGQKEQSKEKENLESPDSDWSDAQEDLNEASKVAGIYPNLESTDLISLGDSVKSGSHEEKKEEETRKEEEAGEQQPLLDGEPDEGGLMDERLEREMPVLLEFSALRELLSLKKRFRRERIATMQSHLTRWFMRQRVSALSFTGRGMEAEDKQMLRIAQAFQPRLHSLAASFIYKDESQVERMLENRLLELRAVPDLLSYGSDNSARIRAVRNTFIGMREDDRRRKEKQERREARARHAAAVRDARAARAAVGQQQEQTQQTAEPRAAAAPHRAAPFQPTMLFSNLVTEMDKGFQDIMKKVMEGSGSGVQQGSSGQQQQQRDELVEPAVEVVEAIYLNPEQQKIFEQLVELQLSEDSEMLLRVARDSRTIDEAVNTLLETL